MYISKNVLVAALAALAAAPSNSFSPSGIISSSSKSRSKDSSSALNVRTSYEQSYHTRQKPSFHPDARVNMNNMELDQYSGLPYEEAELLREEDRLRTQLLAAELAKEQEEAEMERMQAREEALARAAEERAKIREADEAKRRAIEEAREEARRQAAEQLAQLRAEEEARYEAIEARAREQAELAAQAGDYDDSQNEYEEGASKPFFANVRTEGQKTLKVKEYLSDEDKAKMVGLTGDRRVQFMDNSLDGSIIKRFPKKPPHHPDSRTNNKHIDMNVYVELTMEEYQAMREEARLEARRLMGKSKQLRAEQEAMENEARMAAVQRGRQVREQGRRAMREELSNRILVKKY